MLPPNSFVAISRRIISESFETNLFFFSKKIPLVFAFDTYKNTKTKIFFENNKLPWNVSGMSNLNSIVKAAASQTYSSKNERIRPSSCFQNIINILTTYFWYAFRRILIFFFKFKLFVSRLNGKRNFIRRLLCYQPWTYKQWYYF